jgi:hypothetical protein
VSASLRNAGFTVKTLENLTDEQFRLALREIARESEKAAVTLVYYAGHGVQIGGLNYLVPVDLASPQREEDIRFASISADEVLSVMHSPYKILVLDACRDNPVLGRSLSKGRGVTYKRGLARISTSDDAASGIFIAYSTEADAIAQDGTGANSPFAESFARHLGERVSVDDMFDLVTRDVLKVTNREQRPFKYASLDTVLCLPADCQIPSPSGPGPDRAAPAATAAEPAAVIEAFRALNSNIPPEQRVKIEQSLWEQHRAHMPAQLPYGKGPKLPDGSVTIWAFEPANTRIEGRKVFTVQHPGRLKDTVATIDQSISDDSMIDCELGTITPLRHRDANTVKLYSSSEQLAKRDKINHNTELASLTDFLCISPARLTPGWVLGSVKWVELGHKWWAAPDIRYRDPASKDVWYILNRIEIDPPDDFGAVLSYRWSRIDCRAHKTEALRTLNINKNHQLVFVYGRIGDWGAIGPGSAAENAQVILCER